jgi:hypothetical protein
MEKIPTLYVRDFEHDHGRYVTDEVTPGCEWVLTGEGVPTRKYDGTCVMHSGDGAWWARREVKPGKPAPDGFVPISTDEVTGKTVGWEPIEQSGFAKYHAEALDSRLAYAEGTYELFGPKINGNPEGHGSHVLILHEDAEGVLKPGLPPKALVRIVSAERGWEGIVWHHPDGRMVKLKARDLRPAE